jgi:hypothetical protein
VSAWASAVLNDDQAAAAAISEPRDFVQVKKR